MFVGIRTRQHRLILWATPLLFAILWLSYVVAALRAPPGSIATALDWGVYGAPESFLVDGKGIVRWKHVGPLTDELIAMELLPLVTRIEAER